MDSVPSRNEFISSFDFARCTLRVALMMLVLISPHFSSIYADESILKTLSARVVKAAEDGMSIEVDFRNPATEKVERLIFVKDGQSGLSGIDSLLELRTGQVVNIDYAEDERRRLCIRRIAKVKLSGPPPGLENFRGL